METDRDNMELRWEEERNKGKEEYKRFCQGEVINTHNGEIILS